MRSFPVDTEVTHRAIEVQACLPNEDFIGYRSSI